MHGTILVTLYMFTARRRTHLGNKVNIVGVRVASHPTLRPTAGRASDKI